MKADVRFDAGSFRDPAGKVFEFEGEIYRSLDSQAWAAIAGMAESGFLSALISEGLVVNTDVVVDGHPKERLNDLMPESAGFLRHSRIPFLNYPYEWSRSMLVDAASLQLGLQLRLLKEGYSLKDASAYNIQFVGCEPVFMDIGSFEVPSRKDVWIAFGQFCRHFFFPLVLHHYNMTSTKGYFLANMEGIDVLQVRKALGFWKCLKPFLVLDVFLQAYLHKCSMARSDQGVARRALQGEGQDAFAQEVNLKRMLKKVQKLRSRPRGRDTCGRRQVSAREQTADVPIASCWIEYEKTNSYGLQAEKAKRDFVTGCLASHHPRSVLDLGSNTGLYSILAADHGSRVVALDSDHDSIEALYWHAKEEKKDVLPLWMDVANMSPGVGFMNHERRSFLARAQFDCVFALALVHHLLVTSRIPLERIRDFLFDLTEKWLVVECVPVEDPMFQVLLGHRENIYAHISTERFESIFETRFKRHDLRQIPDTKRSIYLYEKI